MIRLTDIRESGDRITAKAYVEDSKEPMELTYSVSGKSFAPYRLPRGYEYCTSHVEMARRYFAGEHEDPLPKSRTIMWY